MPIEIQSIDSDDGLSGRVETCLYVRDEDTHGKNQPPAAATPFTQPWNDLSRS